jgi:hypothetical protein
MVCKHLLGRPVAQALVVELDLVVDLSERVARHLWEPGAFQNLSSHTGTTAAHACLTTHQFADVVLLRALREGLVEKVQLVPVRQSIVAKGDKTMTDNG